MIDSIPDGAIQLDPYEELYVHPGMMQASRNVSMVTQYVAGIFESLKRLIFDGPSLFNNKFQAGATGGWILIQESVPGQLQMVELHSNESFKVRRDRWVGSSPDIELNTVYEGISGYFRGTGVAMTEAALKADAQMGKLFFRCDRGTVKKIEIHAGESPVTIDNDSILGYSSGLDAKSRFAGDGLTSIMFGSEGLVYDFQGEGAVYIASTPQDKDKPTEVLHHHYNNQPKPFQK